MKAPERFIKDWLQKEKNVPPDRLENLSARADVSGATSIGVLAAGEGLVEESDLRSALEAYVSEDAVAGGGFEAENAVFGLEAVKRGFTGPADVWTALKEQANARAGGSEKSLDWFLGSRGKISADQAFAVLGETGRRILLCPDCGRRELHEADSVAGRATCTECQGLMRSAKAPADLAVRRKSADDPLIEREIGGCIIESLLGKGGMGAVYKARHIALNKAVAVKILSGGLEREEARKRFLREARSAARLEHGNVVQVYDTGVEGKICYIVMQFIEGESASARVKREGPQAVDEALRIAIEASRGIRAAHRVALVHRDIKPDNLMIDLDGEVKVADFGLAKDLEGGGSLLTVDGQAMGTPHYMAPEQARDASTAGPPADIYSLGATLFTLLSGNAPFMGSSAWEVVSAAMNNPAPDIREFRADVSDGLAELLLRMMEKEPKKRPQTMDAVIEELSAVRSSLSQAVAPPPPPGPAPHATLDDLPTPATYGGMNPAPAQALRKQADVDTQMDAGRTIPRAEPGPKKKSLVVPGAVAVLVLAVVAAAVVFGSGWLEKETTSGQGARLDLSGGTDREGAGNSDNGPRKTKKTGELSDPAGETPASPQKKDETERPDGDPEGPDPGAVEREGKAAQALRKAKMDASRLIGREDFTGAIAAYDAVASEFEGTEAASRAREEKDGVLNIALERFNRKIAEIEAKLEENRKSEASEIAVALGMALAKMQDLLGNKLPDGFSTVRTRYEEKRESMETSGAEAAELDLIEKKLGSVPEEGEPEVRAKLAELAKSGNPENAARAGELLEKLAGIAKAREDGRERETFARAQAQARVLIESGDAEGAEGVIRKLLLSSNAEVKAEAREILEEVRKLKEELSGLEETRAGAAGLSPGGGFSDLERIRSRLPAFEESGFSAVRKGAARVREELEKAEEEIFRDLKKKGYTVVRKYSGEVGSDDPSDGNGKRTVDLSPFVVGLREVTCREFAEFVSATGGKAPAGWPEGKCPKGSGNLPVTGVSAGEAEAYCAWLGEKLGVLARLPTEEEWEVAAGCKNGSIQAFPWGVEFDKKAANLSGSAAKPAGAHPMDRSPCGALDMAGNVCEWTRSADGKHVIRGGSFEDVSPRAARCAFRTVPPSEETRQACLGFRVALELK